MRILGCSAKDEADEVALLMFQQLLGPTRYEIEVIGDEKLTSEVVAEAGEKQTGLVCIAAVQPGGLTILVTCASGFGPSSLISKLS